MKVQSVARIQHSRALIKFGAVGIAATLVHMALAIGLVERFGADPVWANVPAFLGAVVVSYIGNHRWTFRSSARHASAFPRFLAVAILGLLLNQLIMFLVVRVWGWWYGFGLGAVVIAVPAVTYLLARAWSFKQSSETRSG